MAAHTYSVTLHHLAPGAKAAGLAFADEQLVAVTVEQLNELLNGLEEIAAHLTIYEPSSPEIRIKTEREVFVVRTRYRRLCLVGSETALRGEEHSIAYIIGAITGQAAPVTRPVVNPRVFERPPTAAPLRMSGRDTGGGMADWVKLALMVVLSIGFAAGGIWMLFRPARSFAPKYALMSPPEAAALLTRTAGEYQTGTADGDRRLIIAADGTLRIAKYGAEKVIAEEIIRTARGATQDGIAALVTSDPYLMRINDTESVTLYGQTFKRVTR